MPYIKILIHVVWAIKGRKELLTRQNKDLICRHIKDNADSKNIYLLNINGHTNHLHALISLSSDQNISGVMGLIKGESSFWANRNLQLPEKLKWQDEYFAVSIGESQADRIYRYIERQDEHHKTKTFKQEYEEFIRKYGFMSVKG